MTASSLETKPEDDPGFGAEFFDEEEEEEPKDDEDEEE